MQTLTSAEKCAEGLAHIGYERKSARGAAPIAQLCARRGSRWRASLGMQNGGSARDYLLGFAWSGATVMVQRASGCPYVYSSVPSV